MDHSGSEDLRGCVLMNGDRSQVERAARMDLKTTLRGCVETVKNVRYLRDELLGRPHYDRSQAATMNNYLQIWGTALTSLRGDRRLSVIHGRFADVSHEELDHYFLQAHFDSLRPILGGADQPAIALSLLRPPHVPESSD